MKVRPKWPIAYDGKLYHPGEVLEVTPDQARELAASGSIELELVIESEPPTGT